MRRVRLPQALAAVLLCTLLLSANARGATTITGFSSQGSNQYWPLGAQTYAETMTSKYQQDRIIVPWSTALRPGTADWNQMNDWYSYRVARGKRMLVSFDHWNGCREIIANDPSNNDCRPLLPDSATYANAIATFRRTWPQVKDFTAWNEPNHSVSGDAFRRPDGVNGTWYTYEMNPVDAPDVAADYYKLLSDECRVDRGAGTCTAAAGDFADGSLPMGSYPYTYRDRVTVYYGLTPPAWAVHAYSAVNSNTPSWINEFFDRIRGTRPAWITEVGVKVCDAALPFQSDAAQTAAAGRLVELMSTLNPERTYYYMLFGGQSQSTCPSGGAWDSGLLYQDPANTQLSTLPRPAFDVLFPELGDMFWALRNENSGGPHERGQVFPGHGIPVAGDWDGDGDDTPGMFDPTTGTWYLTNSDSGQPEAVFTYGVPGDRPVVGDWDGNGRDTIGVVRGGTWYLRNFTSAGPNDVPAFDYGFASDLPVVGDWDGNGTDTPGMLRGSTWYLRNSNSAGSIDVPAFDFGVAGDRPLAGDWNADGIDTPGIARANTWYLRNSNTSGADDLHFDYGLSSDLHVVGDWTADGVHRDTPGIVR